MAVLRRLELAAALVDVAVTHASAKSCTVEDPKQAGGWAAARDEQTKWTLFRKVVPGDAAFLFVQYAVETCGNMCKERTQFVNHIGDICREWECSQRYT